MEQNLNQRLFINGGILGIVGTLCYVLATTIQLNPKLTYVIAMAWPILSLFMVYALYRFIALKSQSSYNQLSFLFACLAFSMVSMMMSIQLAVRFGIGEYILESTGGERELLELSERSIRLVDMGLDVAWDLFIGVSLIFLSLAIRKSDSFGIWWSLPASILGVGIIVLNVVTFPWPPNTRGLVDIGPAVGLFIIILSIRLMVLGIRMRRTGDEI